MTGTLQALLEAADLLLLGGDVPEALEQLAQAATLAPDDPLPHLRRAEILVRQGAPADWHAALAALDAAEARGLATANLYFLRMRACAALGQLAAAQAAHAAAVALNPDDARLREWAVRLALAAHDLAGALACVQAERTAAPDNFHWARWEAELLLESGAARAALAAYDALLADHYPVDLAPGDWAAPTWAAILYGRAAVHDQLGDAPAAQADRTQAALLVSNPTASSR